MSNKALLVIGASSEVGIELIKRIYKNYDTIYAHYNSNKAPIEELQKLAGDSLIPVQANLLDYEDTKKIINIIKEKNIYPQHIVHLSSPKCSLQHFNKTGIEEFEASMKCSVFSFSLILSSLIKQISNKETKSKIAVMLSICTKNLPPNFMSSYVTAKYALLGLCKSLAVEYSNKGICINSVSPDMMETKFISNLPELAIEQAKEKSVSNKLLKPSEVVQTFEFLLSDASDAITGQNIAISGVK